MNSARARTGAGHLTGDWGAKKPETIRRRKPLYRRAWVRRLAFTLFGVAMLTLGAALIVALALSIR